MTDRIQVRPRTQAGCPRHGGELLASARALFATRGFRSTSVRAIAADAGVDPALVHHYFGTKDDLFVAALELPVDPRVVLAPVVEGGVEGAGERLLRAFLSVWDDEDGAAPAARPGARRGRAGGPDAAQGGLLGLIFGPLARPSTSTSRSAWSPSWRRPTAW